jgi:hypothetical protein
MQIFRTDRGGEYMSTEFRSYCHNQGIKRELTQAATPQQNGISERRNMTLVERARSLANECKLPLFLWPEAIATANYLVNRSPTRANNGVTPKEMFSGKVPCISNLRIFGCLAYVHIPKENRKKMDSKTQLCLFVGYDTALRDFWTFMLEILEELLDFSEAIKDEGWLAAINREKSSILKNGTWEIVERESWMKPISTKWIFKVKRGLDGKVLKLKARLVAMVDFDDIFSRVVRWSSI